MHEGEHEVCDSGTLKSLQLLLPNFDHAGVEFTRLLRLPRETFPSSLHKGKQNYRVHSPDGQTTVEVQLKSKGFRIIKSAKEFEGSRQMPWSRHEGPTAAWAAFKVATDWA